MAKRRKRKGGAKSESPTSSCLLICDDVIVSTLRGKHTLHGVVNKIRVLELPAKIGPFVAYVRLSNVYSKSEITLSFRRADDDEEVFSFGATAPKDTNPLATHTLVLRIPAFEIEAAGRYIFSARHDDVPFAETPIAIETLDQRETT